MIARSSGWARVVLALVITLSVIVPARAATAQPAPHSARQYVLQEDGEYGYQMLVPAGWESMNMGDSRAYMPPGSSASADRVMVLVTNYRSLPSKFPAGTQVVQLELFRKNPTLAGWTGKLEGALRHNGLAMKRERTLAAAVTFSAAPTSSRAQLLTYKVDKEQPLAVGIFGHGKYGNGTALGTSGFADDFARMAGSLKANPDKTSRITAPEPNVAVAQEPGLHRVGNTASGDVQAAGTVYNGSTAVNWGDTEGGYHCHGSTCGYDYKWQLATHWEPSAHKVHQLFEYMWYRHSNLRPATLDRTEVTDDPYFAFQGHPTDYIYRVINKSTSGSQYWRNDSYWGYWVNRNIDSGTLHGMVYGEGIAVLANRWKPFCSYGICPQ